ncbi:MAG: crotonase/enoyl-CoA hydratase family protein, partial [Candidatus Binatia bacterium]
MSSDNVTLSIEQRVALIRLDDGKANALSPETITHLSGVLDEAEENAGAVVLTGREGRFSGGFDLSVMMSGSDAARGLVTSGAELLIRLYSFPLPVTVACTGHAVAAGALLLLAADTRIGVRGAFKIGLNEVAIGMRLPVFAATLASERLSKRHFTAATQLARLYDPEAAVDAGYLDRVVDAEGHLAQQGAQVEAAHRRVRLEQEDVVPVQQLVAQAAVEDREG